MMKKIILILAIVSLSVSVRAQHIIAQVSSGLGDGCIFDNHNSLKFNRINTWDNIFQKENYIPLVAKAGAGISNIQGGVEFQWDAQPQIYTYAYGSYKIDRIYWGGFARFNTGDEGSSEMFVASLGLGKSFEETRFKNNLFPEFSNISRDEYWNISLAAGVSINVLEPFFVTAEVTTDYLHSNPFEKGARFDQYYQWRLGILVGITLFLDI